MALQVLRIDLGAARDFRVRQRHNDPRVAKLFLARDRLGEKPLY
ncbi:hypothetical protein [Streptomyces sp. MN13]